MLNRSDLQDSHGRLGNNNPNYERLLIPIVLDKSASLDMELQNGLSYQWCHLGSSTAVLLIMAVYCISPCPWTSTRDSFPILCGSTIPPTQPVAVESTKFVTHACPHLPMFHVHVPPANPFLYSLATSRMQTFRILSTYLVHGVFLGIPINMVTINEYELWLEHLRSYRSHIYWMVDIANKSKWWHPWVCQVK